MKIQKELLDAFFNWLKTDQHKDREDIYAGQINFEYLSNLSREDFLKFFFEFTHAGGMVQSGGERFADRLSETIRTDYDVFRTRILETFNLGSKLDQWLTWAQGVKFFSPSTATIFLNRVDKYKYIIVNGKSIGGLEKLGFKIPYGTLLKLYKKVETAEKSLLNDNPELDNFFRVDALMHFIVAEDEGKAFFESEANPDYFDLRGFALYKSSFGKQYDANSDATKWYKDTRSKLEFLVDLLRDRLSEDIMINYSEIPNARAGLGKPPILKRYVLTGFSPDGFYPEHGEFFIKLAFHTLDTQAAFDIEFDQNHNAPERPFKDIIDRLRESSRLRMAVDDQFPKDWEALFATIKGHVKILISEYRNLVNQKVANELPDKVSDGNYLKTTNSSGLKMPPLNTILYGPPGTGKTYITQALAVAAVKSMPYDVKTEVTDAIKKEFRNYLQSGQVVFCTFHQSIGYEDFIEGIKPLPPEPGKPIQYDVVDGIFKDLALTAESNFEIISNKNKGLPLFEDAFEKLKEDWDTNREMKFQMKTQGKEYTVTAFGNKSIYFRKASGGTGHSLSINTLRDIYYGKREAWDSGVGIYYPGMVDQVKKRSLGVPVKTDAKNYVLIIDEINRGNIPQIFGEIISLIEEDKRNGAANALTVTLPYSKDPFSVPPNLFIIGTMNTADRSVEALDTALRRRFSFIDMEPDPQKLKQNFDGINLNLLLETINSRLEILLDKDHTIGHAWLMDVADLDGLQKIFENKIIPLLKEFFYNEYEKIGLVLNENFFVGTSDRRIELSGFKPGADIASEHKNKRIMKLKSSVNLTKEDFISIYKTNNNPV